MSRWRNTLATSVFVALVPFTPFIYVSVLLSNARERRRMARFREVISIAKVEEDAYRLAGHGYRLQLADGSELYINPDAVKHATWEDWGDGINGSRIVRGMCFDRNVYIRFDGWE